MTTFIVQPTSEPDRQGHRRFFAYWWDRNIGPHCDEEGWRGQAFHADFLGWIGRHEAQGDRVEVVGSEDDLVAAQLRLRPRPT